MVAAEVCIKLLASLEGLNPHFNPEALAATRVRGRKEDFARIGVDLNKAFDPVPNVINSEFILFDVSDIGSRLIEFLVTVMLCFIETSR